MKMEVQLNCFIYADCRENLPKKNKFSDEMVSKLCHVTVSNQKD